jgi:hypothetical protein
VGRVRCYPKLLTEVRPFELARTPASLKPAVDSGLKPLSFRAGGMEGAVIGGGDTTERHERQLDLACEGVGPPGPPRRFSHRIV